MTDLPPPPPPPPADERPRFDPSSSSSSGDQRGPSVNVGEMFAGEWDAERVKALGSRWFQPLVEIDTWKAVAYLFVGMITSIAFLAISAVVGGVVFGLMFVGVGFLLVGPAFGLIDRFCRVDRSLAAWIDVEIPPREVSSRPGWFGLKRITDPERWRMVGYVAVNALLAPTLFSLGFAGFSLATQAAGSGWNRWNAAAPILIVLRVILAAIFLGAAPRIARFVATIKARVAAWFLGPDELAIARQRVDVLATQRSDILDAVASERRRIERNLHDGVQQQLVAIGLDLSMAEQHIDDDPARARELLGLARSKVQGSVGELRQLGRGLHPAILEDRGLDAALSAVVANSPTPISVHVDPQLDLDTDTSETIYFVANEAIGNVLKHAKATVASVHITRVGGAVRITVHDNGVGGIDITRGTGVAGMRARVRAVDGSIEIASPPGGPTMIVADIPLTEPRHD